MFLRVTYDKELKLDFARVRQAMSNHIASGVMDAALCNIISHRSTVHTPAHSIIYNCTKWCERETCSKGDMLVAHSWRLGKTPTTTQLWGVHIKFESYEDRWMESFLTLPLNEVYFPLCVFGQPAFSCNPGCSSGALMLNWTDWTCPITAEGSEELKLMQRTKQLTPKACFEPQG